MADRVPGQVEIGMPMVHEPGQCSSIDELVTDAAGDAGAFTDTLCHFGADHPRSVAVLDFGLSFASTASATPSGLAAVRAYRSLVDHRDASGWMDNTTLVTASALMSDSGHDALTPLTIWDLVTFARAVIGYEHVYHHKHDAVDTEAMNRQLGDAVFHDLPVPLDRHPTRILPEPWEGPHRLMCDLWSDAFNWLKRLAGASQSRTTRWR